ncbi:iron chaperone [Cellulomonas sp. HZM]|uniref:iron chaperone n=1 Tax=Cellulomonas sp. HZM TaxID=1454010 RepID=UPI000492FBEA|nr:DUF1801 domain-containing protein [Cellulomonas sp. HZM]
MAAQSVDDYLVDFDPDVQEILQNVRLALHRGMPGAHERISYGMPTIVLGDATIHFAGWAAHVGIYPVPRFTGPLEDAVEPHRGDKATVRFPYAPGVPYDLVEQIAEAIAAQRGA